MTDIIIKLKGCNVPLKYLHKLKHESDIARIAAGNKIMAVVYDGLGFCDISGWEYTPRCVEIDGITAKMKGSLFEYIVALLYVKGNSGNRIAMRILYMLLQLLLWVADSDRSSDDPIVHYRANALHI